MHIFKIIRITERRQVQLETHLLRLTRAGKVSGSGSEGRVGSGCQLSPDREL